jgi:hypothetical protein
MLNQLYLEKADDRFQGCSVDLGLKTCRAVGPSPLALGLNSYTKKRLGRRESKTGQGVRSISYNRPVAHDVEHTHVHVKF